MTMNKDTFYLPPDDPDLDRDYITGREFQEGTKTAVRTISSDFDTNVIFAGTDAKTNGHEVFLPQQDLDKMMTHRQVEVGRGYANHETLHKLLTDFNVGQAWMHDMTQKGLEFTKSMAQGLEDVRIENGGRILYNGIARSVDKTAEQVCREFKKIADKEPDICKDPWKVLPVAVTWIGRHKLGYPSKAIKQAFENLSPEIQERASKIADVCLAIPHGVEGVGRVNQKVAYAGHKQVLDLAERVSKELAKEQPPTEFAPEENGKKQSGNGSSTSGDNSSGDDKGEENKAPKQNKEGLKQDLSTEKSHGASDSTYETTLQGEPIPFDPNLNQVIHHIDTTKKKKTRSGVRIDQVFSTESDVIEEPKQTQDSSNRTYYRSEYNSIKQRMGSRIATMKRKLEKALITKVDSDWESGTRGRLNVRNRGFHIVSGSQQIRRQRVQGDDVDTAVMLLIDCSGSMSGYPMKVAGESAICLSECLSAGHIPYEVLGHTTMHFQGNVWKEYRASRERGNRYSRECAINMPVFKPFNKELRQCTHNMGFIPTASDNSNADADAIRYAGERLLKRRESNKIMLVLADGYPAWSSMYRRDTMDKMTRQAVVDMQNKGINMVGIGICTSAPRHFFDKHVCINDASDLSKNVLDQVAKLILGSRFAVDNRDVIAV